MIRGTRKYRMRGAAVAACVAAAALPLAACGGDDEEEPATTAAEETTAVEDQEAAVEQTLIDFGNAEGTASCNYFSDSYIEQLGGPEGCNDEFQDAVAADYDVQDVVVSGDSARADVTTDGQNVFFELVNENGEWLISDLRGEEASGGGGGGGPDDEAAIEQTLVDFGSSVGTDACNYFSQSYIQQLGGESGCSQEFKDAVAADYNVSNVSVSGSTATADVTTDGQQISFDLVNEGGEWLISDLSSG